jgi:hypothetical protein
MKKEGRVFLLPHFWSNTAGDMVNYSTVTDLARLRG